MKILRTKNVGISKSFLLAASAYRREIQNHRNYSNLDFSMEAMVQQYNYETHGIGKPDSHVNGYTYGKSIFDVTLKAMQEDLLQGYFCKMEFLEGASALKRKLIHNMMSGTLFAWKI